MFPIKIFHSKRMSWIDCMKVNSRTRTLTFTASIYPARFTPPHYCTLKVLHLVGMRSRDENSPGNKRGRCECRTCAAIASHCFKWRLRPRLFLQTFPAVCDRALRCGAEGSRGRIVAPSFGWGVITKATPFGVSLNCRAVVSVRPT